MTGTLVEKKIGFQNEEFHNRYNELFYSTNEAYNNIANANQELQTIAATKEYNAFKDHLKTSFLWKIGKYAANIDVFISNRKEPYKHQVNFQLTRLDLKNLEKNIEIAQYSLENHYIQLNPEYNASWKWVNPNKI
jgi:formyltetrahydrofolate hydrolase